MGNIALKISLLSIALLLSALAVLLFYKNKIGKKWMLAIITSSFTAAITAVVLLSLLVEPQIKLNGSHSVRVPVFSTYEEKGCAVSVGGKDITDTVTVKSNVDTNVVGKYKVTYTVNYGKKTFTSVRTVLVEDKILPLIKLNGEEKITVSDMKFYKESGASAYDNYDGDISANIEITERKINSDKYNVIYTVKDAAGNKTSLVREVEIKDIVKPVITLKNKETIYIDRGGQYTDYGATASDDMDGDLTEEIRVSGTVNTEILGSYNISYTVEDLSGNVTTVIRRVVVRVPEDPTQNRICLTFDDGPSKVTIQILDILKKNDIKATFFICDYSEDKLPIIQRIINEGHAIGIHGYSHDYAKIYKSEAAFMNNINKLHDKLLNDTGYDTNIMRFPGGSSNTVSEKYCKGIMKKLKVTVTDAGWRYFDWNVSSDDATGSISANAIYKSTISGLKKKRTNVVLMHDLGTKKTTADALQKIIDYANENSYSFWAIDDTIPQIVH